MNELGSCDLLVANAGIGSKVSWDEVDLDLWQNTMDVNLRAPWLMTKAAMKPPIISPSPPSTQIMKMRGPKVLPMKGWTSYCNDRRQAASPASAPPIAEVTR